MKYLRGLFLAVGGLSVFQVQVNQLIGLADAYGYQQSCVFIAVLVWSLLATVFFVGVLQRRD